MSALPNIKQKPFNTISAPHILVPNKILARAIQPEDYLNFKDTRLRALKEEEQCFSSTYMYEASLPDTYWIKKSTPTKDYSFFGLFDGNRIIGIMYAEKWGRDKTGETALWGAAYVMPEYRGKGISSKLYKCRENWTKKHPTYKKCLFTLFSRNKKSAQIHKKRGATYLFTETLKLLGRPDTPLHYYGRAIKPKLHLLTAPSHPVAFGGARETRFTHELAQA